MMHEMYRDNILDHGMNPRNRAVLQPANVDYEATNPQCGDRLRLTLRLDEHERIAEIGWSGESCVITQASSSLLGERILGKTLDEVRQISKQDIFDMLEVSLSANRVRCALVPLQALTIGLFGQEAWQQHQLEDDE